MSQEQLHISDELPRLLCGEATRDEVLAAAAHLRSCEDCQQELVSAVVAHASLTSAQRFAPEIVARPAEAGPDGAANPDSDNAVLPDLSEMFAKVRAQSTVADLASRRRGLRPMLAVAAVAAGVLVVGGGALALTHHSSSGGSKSIALTAFDEGTSSAKATVSGQTMQVDATSLPKLDASERYEVWLTNPTRTQMKPIGWIGDNGTAKLTVPSDLMGSYSDIEVSVQQVNVPSYAYSGTSVLRGAYAA
jgi:hypothetical protein